MSDPVPKPTSEEFERVEARRAAAARSTLMIYQTVTVLMLLGIAGLALYAFKLGPLVGPGVESSFGYSVAAMFLMGALLAHIADRTYREWPLGRKFRPSTPRPVTPRRAAWFVSWIVVVAAIAGGAFVLAQLLM